MEEIDYKASRCPRKVLPRCWNCARFVIISKLLYVSNRRRACPGAQQSTSKQSPTRHAEFRIHPPVCISNPAHLPLELLSQHMVISYEMHHMQPEWVKTPLSLIDADSSLPKLTLAGQADLPAPPTSKPPPLPSSQNQVQHWLSASWS